MQATTYGTGELIRAAVEEGVRDIILGLGGSATVDGGTGMAQALGYRLLTADGSECRRGGEKRCRRLRRSRPIGVLPALADCRIRVACDVTNPLLGEHGAASVFGPQKGATPEMVELLEKGLEPVSRAYGNVRDSSTTSRARVTAPLVVSARVCAPSAKPRWRPAPIWWRTSPVSMRRSMTPPFS